VNFVAEGLIPVNDHHRNLKSNQILAGQLFFNNFFTKK